MSSTTHRLHLLLCATVLGLLLTGCGGGDGDSDGPTATPSPRPSASATPTTSAPPSPPSSPGTAFPTPADGTDLKACADGRCEVEVRSGDRITFTGDRVRLDSFTVVRIADNVLTYKAAGPGTSFDGRITVPGTLVVNDLEVEVVAVDGDRAVIRLS